MAGLDRAIVPVRRIGTPVSDTVGPMDYVALQRSGDTDDPRHRLLHEERLHLRSVARAHLGDRRLFRLNANIRPTV